MTLAEGLPFLALFMASSASLIALLGLKYVIELRDELGWAAGTIGDELGDHAVRLETLEGRWDITQETPAGTTDDEVFELFPTAAPIGGTNYPWDN
jgi:hypothetical protein